MCCGFVKNLKGKKEFKKIVSRILKQEKKWWSHLESNQAPTDYESVALTE